MESALFSLVKIALRVDRDRIAAIENEFKTIISALLKESSKEAPKETPKEAPKEAHKEPSREDIMNEFMQRNITEQFMGRSPSLVIHPVPHEQPRYIPQFMMRPSRPEFNFSFIDPSENDDDIHSVGSIKSIHVVKAPSLPTVKKLDDDEMDLLNTAFCINPDVEADAADAIDTMEDEADEADEADEDAASEFEEFPLKDGMHYKNPNTNIVYKEKEGINRVGVFNTDTNKFKRDAK